jgi:hypothetical protein
LVISDDVFINVGDPICDPVGGPCARRMAGMNEKVAARKTTAEERPILELQSKLERKQQFY